MKKSGDKKYTFECDTLRLVKENLEKGIFAAGMELDDAQRALVSDLFLLTDKPMLYAANISEDDSSNTDQYALPQVAALLELSKTQGAEVMVICAKLEEELSTLSSEEQQMFLEELGIAQSGLAALVQKSYKLLNLISYLTAGEKEVRAWTIERGTKAPGAAGKIHSDFERGFIRAEIVAFEDIKACGDMATAKAKGLVRQEGKDYVMQDGDVTLFKFNV
jgi:GTP-binding protein YchF